MRSGTSKKEASSRNCPYLIGVEAFVALEWSGKLVGV